MLKAACAYHPAIASVGKGKSCRSNTQHFPLVSLQPLVLEEGHNKTSMLNVRRSTNLTVTEAIAADYQVHCRHRDY